jgi:hypothetical protein
MGLFDWIKRFRKHEDEVALERFKAERLESTEERRISEGDFEGRQADEQAGLIFRDEPGEAERLAEGDD